MRIHTLMLALIGVILASASIDAHSTGTHPIAATTSVMVDRTLKSDRLWIAKADAARTPSRELRPPQGCDGLVSTLTRSPLARIATRCES